jgi:hydroxypyruvate isomerase
MSTAIATGEAVLDRTPLLSAHIGYLFNELPLAERMKAAAETGFTAVEHPQPFAIDATEMRKIVDELGLAFAQLAGGAGDARKGEKGLASLPGREADFRASFDKAVDYASIVGAPYVHPMAGVPGDADPARAHDAYLENIRYAVERTANTGIKVLIEAISSAAVPGYAISTLDKAASVQDSFGPGNIALLVDTFHAAVTNVDLPTWIGTNGHRIGHMHIADFPGRHEPGTGNIDFDAILQALTDVGFAGAIGFEYMPSQSTIQSARFLKSWLTRTS